MNNENKQFIVNKIITLVAEILHLSEDTIVIDKLLTEYGISSLSTFILVQKINKQFDCNFSLDDLVENFSITAMSKIIFDRQQEIC